MTRYPSIGRVCGSKLLFVPRPNYQCIEPNGLPISALKNHTFLRSHYFCNIPPIRTLNSDAKERESLPSENLRKILKVAIIGVPNAGKSTLINQIVGRNVSTFCDFPFLASICSLHFEINSFPLSRYFLYHVRYTLLVAELEQSWLSKILNLYSLIHLVSLMPKRASSE